MELPQLVGVELEVHRDLVRDLDPVPGRRHDRVGCRLAPRCYCLIPSAWAAGRLRLGLLGDDVVLLVGGVEVQIVEHAVQEQARARLDDPLEVDALDRAAAVADADLVARRLLEPETTWAPGPSDQDHRHDAAATPGPGARGRLLPRRCRGARPAAPGSRAPSGAGAPSSSARFVVPLVAVVLPPFDHSWIPSARTRMGSEVQRELSLVAQEDPAADDEQGHCPQGAHDHQTGARTHRRRRWPGSWRRAGRAAANRRTACERAAAPPGR